MDSVNVCPNIMEIHTLIADQNAFIVLIVIKPKLVFKENALTRALVHADKMLCVKLLNTFPCAAAIVALLEMHLYYAILLEVNYNKNTKRLSRIGLYEKDCFN